GSENLNLNDNSFISRVKFIMNSAILDERDHRNHVLALFKRFVNGMLLFYSLRENGFIGFREKGYQIEDIIVGAGKTKDFEEFLSRSGPKLTLVNRISPEGKKIYVKYQNGEVPFFTVASTGMVSLILFYSWLISLDGCSFVFIDEFDAFYHHDLAELIIRELLHHEEIQIFATTHNTDLMSNDLLRPDSYFILNDRDIKSLNHCTERDLRFAHNLQKMYKAGAFVDEEKR
ncbi:MAG: ATP-binding protein, partial [Bacilli bacterium]|nr:ATP-binding protein [Bacilli bacterium]